MGLLFVATLGTVFIRGGESVPPGSLLFQLLLLTVAALFFVGSWCRGGQTPGMRAWRLRVEGLSGEPLSWQRALLRFAAALLSTALLGLGFFWSLVDRDKQTWHDRLARTRVVVLPKRSDGGR